MCYIWVLIPTLDNYMDDFKFGSYHILHAVLIGLEILINFFIYLLSFNSMHSRHGL